MRRTLLVLGLALALALTVAACGGSSDNTTTTPTATGGTGGGGGNVDAAALFADNCAGCHGSDGSGGFGPDLRNEDNVDRVVQQVTNGGDKMPAFGDKLSGDEIQALADYVTTQL